MSDTDDLNKFPTSDDEDSDPRKTQAVKQPRSRGSKDAGEIDPIRDTNILSRDNPILRRVISQQASSSDPNGTTTLGDTREVILLVRGMVERIVLQEGKTYKLGRFDLGAKADDEIDLTPYGAMDRGVSRHHATLHIEDGKLLLTDLESTNGTYLSGNKLEPNEPTALHKGDEVLLGRLALQILFR